MTRLSPFFLPILLVILLRTRLIWVLLCILIYLNPTMSKALK
jgi:hypothetical protein